MKIAIVLLVHKNPQQVARLIKRLSHPDIDCWVHIDKKFDSKIFRDTLSAQNVFFVQPNIRVDWGCYNTVEAMLLALQNAVAAREKYSYIVFLSGQDYILQPPDVLLNYLNENNGLEHMSIQPYESAQSNIIRIEKYHLNGYTFRGKKFLERIINKMLPRRKFPYPFEIRKGSQWFTITKNAAVYILQFVAKNPGYANYFKLVDTPDEFFFQTILYNSEFRYKIRDGVLHYTDWSEKKKHPKFLTITDKDKLRDSYYFFARKFDMAFDAKILDVIDKEKLAPVSEP